ncbi:MAG TPA: mersacidin/lichenicidin family type 2 lantibiotic [Thermoanaerobaculia bacterium]|nr:mersacidin/lichenicidin family type 2 lantibiotic [Thermoanaerobaculia bacterium]
MKKKLDVVRAWRDEEYRNSLSAEERAALPENPAGIATISDETLRSISGGCCLSNNDGCSRPACSCVVYPQQCP